MPQVWSLNRTLRKVRSTGRRRGLSCHRQGRGGDGSSDVDWDLSGDWELDSGIECTSAFVNGARLDMAEVSLAGDFGTFSVERQGNTGRIYRAQSHFERTTILSGDDFSYSYEGTLLDSPGDFDVFGTVLSDDLVEIREEILITTTRATLICHYFMRKI